VRAGGALRGELANRRDRGVDHSPGDRGLPHSRERGRDGLDAFTIGRIVEQLECYDRTADEFPRRGCGLPMLSDRRVGSTHGDGRRFVMSAHPTGACAPVVRPGQRLEGETGVVSSTAPTWASLGRLAGACRRHVRGWVGAGDVDLA
jgi:hypothetical protein